jgi:hypothetical protein
LINNLIKKTKDSLILENKEKNNNNNDGDKNIRSESLLLQKSEKKIVDLTNDSKSSTSIKRKEQPFITSNSVGSSTSSNSEESSLNRRRTSIAFPKAKSGVTAIGLLSTLIHETKTLEVSEVYTDGTSEVHSFAGQIFKCDGFYSSSQITIKDAGSYVWIVLVGLILAILFTIILNSY